VFDAAVRNIAGITERLLHSLGAAHTANSALESSRT
jgi:hypothetical protein